MLEKTIYRIEQRIQSAPALTPETRSELLDLLSQLRRQLKKLPDVQLEKAQSVVGFAEVSTNEATRSDTDTSLFDVAIDGLQKSVREFEQTHPRLVDIVNSISTTLSNLGI